MRWAVDKQTVTIGLLSVGLLIDIVPKVMDIKHETGSKYDRETVNHGEIVGAGAALIIGGACSIATNDWLPLFASALTALVLFQLYERSMPDYCDN